MTIRRRFEVHRLTMSGLSAEQEYGSFLIAARSAIPTLPAGVFVYGARSHLLYDLHLAERQRIRIRFISYTTGHRPDILDTQVFSIEPNPLAETQTGIDWTHILGGRVSDRYLLLMERGRTAISPAAVERYLQWMIDREYAAEDSEDREPIVVSIEGEAGEEFLSRLNRLTRVSKALVRTVRPNPGWSDLETELAREASASDAHKTEIAMTARRRASLKRNAGIVSAIRRLLREHKLDYAAIEGSSGTSKERFNTERLVRSVYVDLETDDRGQVAHSDAWQHLSRVMDELE